MAVQERSTFYSLCGIQTVRERPPLLLFFRESIYPLSVYKQTSISQVLV
ncbi:hypothetical protein LINGRAHAP2_LOCUS33533 [Linum grandiflorum]